MPVFEGEGVKLYYEEKGDGQPIAFVHGTVCDYTAWSAQTATLSSRFRTIAYSRRYARPNERQGNVLDSTVQNNVSDLRALVRGLGMERVHLVGHSYGGFVAAYFATAHPDLLRSLVLVNPAIFTMLVSGSSTTASLALLLRSPRVALSARRLVNAVNATIRAVDSGDKSAADKIFVSALENGAEGLPAKPPGFSQMVTENSGTLKETTAPFPRLTAREVRNIETPTLVVWGERSAPWDSRISEMLCNTLPASEGAKISGAGHFCLVEKPDEVNLRVMSFLLSHS